MGNGAHGTSMQTYRTPRSAARRAKAIRRQDKAWAARAGAVEVAYACICERTPASCRAAAHTNDA